MLHPNTEMKFVSKRIGYGIFATELIPRGTIIWVMDQMDRIISAQEVNQFTEPSLQYLMKYTYRNKNGDFVFCWDLTRYMNHSHDPNSILTPLGFEMAIKDIQPGEELTNDYGTLNVDEPFKSAYVSKDGREWVRPDDILTFHKKWDEQIRNAFPNITKVKQPLSDFLSPELKKQIAEIREGKEKMPSILENHFHADE